MQNDYEAFGVECVDREKRLYFVTYRSTAVHLYIKIGEYFDR